MKKKEQTQKENTMSNVVMASTIMSVLEKGLQESQDNRGDQSPEYRLGKMDAYLEVLSILNANNE